MKSEIQYVYILDKRIIQSQIGVTKLTPMFNTDCMIVLHMQITKDREGKNRDKKSPDWLYQGRR